MTRLDGNLRRMALVRFLFWTHFLSSVTVPFFRDWGGLSFTAILLVQAWFMAWSFLLEVPTGAVADRLGRRVSLAAGAFAAGLASLVYASLPSIWVFLLAEVLFALAFTLISGADEALVYDTLAALGREREATGTIARLESFKLAGILTGALTGSLIAARWGLRAPLLAQAVPALLAGVIALGLVEPPGAAGPEPATRPSYREVLVGGLCHLRDPALRALALDLVGNGAIAFLVLWTYQPQLERSGVALAGFGAVHAALSLGQIALLARVELVERLLGGRLRLIRAGALVPPLCFLGLGLTDSPAVSTALVILAAATGLTRGPLFSGALHRRIPSEHRATILSAISALRTLAIALLYPLAGALLDRSLPAAFFALGALGLAAALLLSAPAATLSEQPAAAAPPEG